MNIPKNKLSILMILTVFLMGFTGCTSEKATSPAADNTNTNGGKSLQVIATLFPQYDFAKTIAGDNIDLRLLMPPGTEAHSYEPTPKDLVDIKNADVFIYTSFAMEPWVEKMLKEASPDTLIINATEGVKYLTADEMGLPEHAHEGEDQGNTTHTEEDHEGVDPHVWLDPTNASIMAGNVAKGLIQADPEHKALYENNLKAYQAELIALDLDIANTLGKIQNKEVIFAGHFAFGYFAKKYGLAYHSPYEGFSPDAEPSPQNIAAMIDLMKSENQKVVYYEELIDPKIARIIASETKAEMVMLHAAHNVSKDDLKNGLTYIQIMKENLDKLTKGLTAHE